MVCLSVSILSKTKTLLARQFVEMSRQRVESLLSAFLRLIEPGNKDHTYIETESVRYVYLPIESLYLVLITNKGSNILEDLETLKLMQLVVQSYCESSVNEDTVLTKAFDIVFALDEVISFGYRESVTLGQVRVYTEMESHDEKLSIMIMQSKMREEKKRSAAMAAKLEKERAQKKKEERAMMMAAAAANIQLNRAPVVVNNVISTANTIINDHSNIIGGTTSGVNGTEEVYGGANSQRGPGKGMQIGKKKPLIELFG